MSHITQPYPYQKEGVRMIEEFDGRALLADDMGLGKTFQALLWAYRYLPYPLPGPIVVVCPATIKQNWRREAGHHLGLRAEVLYGRTAPSLQESLDIQHPNSLYVINYDILEPTWSKKTPAEEILRLKQESWVNWLRSQRPCLVIVDECHYIKAMGTKRTKAVKKLCKGVPHVIMISGTPMTNRPVELFPSLNILRPDVFNSFTDYAHEFCNPRKRPWGWEYKGARKPDVLHKLLRDSCMIRRRKSEVLQDLPILTKTVIPFELDRPARKEYQNAVDDFLDWLSRISPRMAKRAARAELLAQYGYLKRLAAWLKLSSVESWIEDFLETDQKLITFAIQRKINHRLMEKFGDAAILVDGSMSDHVKDMHFQKFNRDDRVRLLVGNIQAAGVGWSCKSSSNVCFAEMSEVPGDHNQAMQRIHGLERGLPGVAAFAYFLVAEGTIEEVLCETNQRKQKYLDRAMDGKIQEDTLDLYDEYQRALLRNSGINPKRIPLLV